MQLLGKPPCEFQRMSSQPVEQTTASPQDRLLGRVTQTEKKRHPGVGSLKFGAPLSSSKWSLFLLLNFVFYFKSILLFKSFHLTQVGKSKCRTTD
ncbi:hypothetical protein TNCV_1717431 [Trichonephila clavipes]|nr:hypothetical protein TNCV_1717431 [Trichonephila clavipes]